jgi:hypothetical protein
MLMPNCVKPIAGSMNRTNAGITARRQLISMIFPHEREGAPKRQ